jgi:lysophospholipase L1-like esterase
MDWLPYGSTDPSVLLQHPLTSDPLSYFRSKAGGSTKKQLQGGTTVNVPDNTTFLFDPVLGFCPEAKNEFYLPNLTGYQNLDYGGQISFEVSRAWLANNENASPNWPNSSGYIPASNEFFLSALATTGGAQTIIRKYTTGGADAYLSSTDLPFYVSSQGKGDFVRVNIGWNGGRVGGKFWVAIDDALVSSVTRNSSTLSGMFANFYLGSDRGVAGSYANTGYYIRNLQISNKAPVFTYHPRAGSIAILSDSTANTGDVIYGSYRDAVTSCSMQRRLSRQRNLDSVVPIVSVNGGYRIDNSAPGQYLRDQLPAVLATKPTVVVIMGGTNDAAGSRCSQSTWQAAVADYINDCFATDYVKMVVLAAPMTLTYASAYTAYEGEVLIAKTKMQAAAYAWRAANPTDPRKVVVADRYTALGGTNPPPGTFIGQVDGLSDNLHCSGLGHVLQGYCIADAIIGAL